MISDACLSYLHLQLRMLHRDIKSHNIMVSRDGSVRLIDLGLAVVVRSSGARSKVGTAVDARDEGGYTPLMYAAADGHLEVAKALLAAGAAVDARDEAGKTPLKYAQDGNKPQLVELLRQHGATE